VISAVIFDCDGVLVDSEPLADAVWAEVLAERGYAMTEEDGDACRGRTELATYEYFAERSDLVPYEEHMAALDALRIPRFEEELEAFPDTADTVRALAAQGIPLAVASSSRRRALDRKLEIVGLDRYFDAVVGGDEVARGKPAPDVFLEAARRLGVEAAACLVIEDSEHGAAAATEAGMRTVMIRRDGSFSPTYASVTEVTAEMILSWMWRF
jgi:HAD superfamily hydrolase (TIGR01509 family)